MSIKQNYPVIVDATFIFLRFSKRAFDDLVDRFGGLNRLLDIVYYIKANVVSKTRDKLIVAQSIFDKENIRLNALQMDILLYLACNIQELPFDNGFTVYTANYDLWGENDTSVMMANFYLVFREL